MYPIIVLSLTGLLTLFLGFLKNQKILLPATMFFFFVSLVAGLTDWNHPGMYFNEMIEVTNPIIVVQSILLISGLLITGICSKLFDDALSHAAEYFALMQFAMVGALIMVSFQNFIMLFVGLEILSVALYVLTGSDKRNLRGNEAAIKYFLMGAFATGILLFGIAMIYGATSSFALSGTTSLIGALAGGKIYFWVGTVMILMGLLFKVSAAPFHFWTADVYEGAPAIFTAFMATVVKTAGFFALYRLIAYSFAFEPGLWSNILLGSIVLSLIIGNLTAVNQTSFKRMLAFSSVSQAGFMLLSIIGLSANSATSLAYYSASYALATITAFGVLIVVSSQNLENGRPNENIDVFKGLFKRSPVLAIVLLIAMLSLSGIPITAGFWGKFFVFNDAASKGHIWVLVIAVLMSAVSLYYYFKPVRASFSEIEKETSSIEIVPLTRYILLIACGGIILLGIAPSILTNLMK
jgi:NADH-quinone oxidoreductase subunit N